MMKNVYTQELIEQQIRFREKVRNALTTPASSAISPSYCFPFHVKHWVLKLVAGRGRMVATGGG